MNLRIPKWDPLVTGYVVIELISILIFIYFFMNRG